MYFLGQMLFPTIFVPEQRREKYSKMLSKEAFDQWCWRPGLSDQAKAVIPHIRTSHSSRRVRSSASNASETYPSLKRGLPSSLRATAMKPI